MRTSLMILSLAVLAVVAVTATPDEPPKAPDTGDAAAANSVSSYEAKQANPKLRVTLLGLTKGFAFLDSQEPVNEGGRLHGNNVVPWLRVAVLVERLGDKPVSLEVIDFEIRTADGQELVKRLKVQRPGNPLAIDSRSQGVAIRQLDFQHLESELFPTAPSQVEKPDQSRVLFLTVSGRTRETHHAELRLKLGNATDPEEFVFKEVPLP